jgi:hypothetical protein
VGRLEALPAPSFAEDVGCSKATHKATVLHLERLTSL